MTSSSTLFILKRKNLIEAVLHFSHHRVDRKKGRINSDKLENTLQEIKWISLENFSQLYWVLSIHM